MRRRNLVLIIISLVIIIALIFVIILSNKNRKLGFISDDSRQITLVKEIYSNILNEKFKDDYNVVLNKDTSIYINFITYNHYVISQENSINEVLLNYVSEDSENSYTLSNSFDLKKLTLTVKLEKENGVDDAIYTYKLSTNKKENKIEYKLIKTDFSVE